MMGIEIGCRLILGIDDQRIGGAWRAPSSNATFCGALILAFTPAPAGANAGIGFFTLAWPAVLLGLIPTMGLEGGVLAGLLRLPWRRALALALAANAISTGYGLG
jgi:hypothetical protein